MQERRQLACVEVGGGSIQTVLFDNGSHTLLSGAHHPAGADLAIAAPGLIRGDLVAEASNLGWHDVDPVTELGLRGPAAVVLNDGEAAALGEAAMRSGGTIDRLVYLALGTGIAGAVVTGGRIARSNLFAHNIAGHGVAFGTERCRCGRDGCLETVASGWVLPDPLTDEAVGRVAVAVARAVESEPLAASGIVVIGGGIARRYTRLIPRIAELLPDRIVEGSGAPAGAKSAAAWGLRSSVFGRTLSSSSEEAS